jgi:thermolabile hemolysin
VLNGYSNQPGITCLEKETVMKKKNLFSLVLGILLLAPISVFGASFDTVVAFGDSLSDNGNLYALDPSRVPPAYYWEGRVSNGPVWVEFLADADMLNCELDDNAYAGAQTSGDMPPGLLQQINHYVSTEDLPNNALFVIWIGANDILGESGTPHLPTIVSNIGTALEMLANFGAQNLLILNLPDLGSLPLTRNSESAPLATLTTQVFNQKLAEVINNFAAANPDIKIYQLDIFSLFKDINAHPASYGFTNVTDVLQDLSQPYNFENPDGYVFWDEIHPTTEAHLEIAEQAFELLNSKPIDTGDGDGHGGGGGCFISTVFSFN